MKIIIKFFIILLSLVSCTQTTNVKFSYYDSGHVKEKLIYESSSCYQAYLFSEEGELLKEAYYKDDKLDGNCKTFNNNVLIEEVSYIHGKKNGKTTIFDSSGRIKMIRTYLNDSLNGMTQVYGQQQELKQEYLYINGKQILFNEFYDSNDGALSKKICYIIEGKGELKQMGQIVFDKRDMTPIIDMSFFYLIKNKKDTILSNEKNEIIIELINKFDWNLEVQIGKMDEQLTFIEKPLIYNCKEKKISFMIEPEHTGLITILGKLIITPSKINNPDLNSTHEFILYDEFYVIKN